MLVVFAISVHDVPPFTENCHFEIVPDEPLRVIDPLLLPLQTVALLPVVPPTAIGSTLMVAADEFADAQTPLVTTARYWVVVVRLLKT